MGLFSEKFLNNNENKKPFIADSVSRGKVLGEGWTGTVYKVDVKKDEHCRQFALKDFTKIGSRAAKYAAEQEYQSYLSAKKSGLRVFPTVRLNKNHEELLMTLGTTDNFLLVNGRSSEKWSRVNKIDNIQDLIFKIRENAEKAAISSLEIIWDSYFFIIDKANPTNADFVIGDFGNVRKSNGSEEDIYYKNIHEANRALKDFINNYLQNDNKPEYEKIIDSKLISKTDNTKVK